jgi:hypothetical protein
MAGHDKLTTQGKQFFKQIDELKKLQVRVGFQRGAAQSEDGVDMVDIATFNEVGTAHSPARPFMRQSADANKAKIEKMCKAQLQKVTQGRTAEQTLNAIGAMQKGLIQDTITHSKEWAEPNAESTIKKKSKGEKVSDVPLIDNSRMLQSVNYVVVLKGGGE